ncbi:MFS general substrate transporter [Anaeromyces robustus]|uniref:MFS general substrate transporter n=1 Tax=Anaeromyces robustus TaxID=1754192 RepID=A0A1Y1XEF4_9FUNG|nr:MFS general substrate transporter [Anaeromyces robustus]|eukprot:ORX84148.1 MFS general substrate transporter [Anaeromyces robustus]
MCIIVLSMIMSSLDITIISTALPKISAQFHSYESFTWVITAYMLTNTAIQPIADIFGRKFMMTLTLVLFIISSFICGVSPNIGTLILGRAIQGIGGGGISVLVNVIIADIVPLRKRGVFMGVNGAIFSLSSIIGPLLGGFFTDNLTWRWAFYINVPIGFVCLIIFTLFFKMPKDKGSFMEKIKRIDFIGTISIIGSLVSLLLGLNWGGQKYPWNSTTIISLFTVGIILFIIYIIVENKFAKEPITPPSLFKYRNITFSSLTSFFSGAAFLTCVNTLPLLYQDGRGFSATIAGLRLTPAVFCITISAIGSGFFISKWGHIDIYIKIGSFLMIFSSYCVTLIGMNTELIKEVFIYIFFGLSVGLIFQNCVMSAQQVSPPEHLAISTTLISFFNNIGAVVGVAIHGAYLQNAFPSLYKERYPDYKKPITVNDIHNVPNGPSIYVESLQKTYRYTVIPMTILLFLCSIFIKHYKLNTTKNTDKDNKYVNMEEVREDITVTIDDQASTEVLNKPSN